MRNPSRLLVALALALGLPSGAAAQGEATLTGRVTNESGAPLASASVFLEGMNLGTLTREDGRYSFLVPGARVQGQQVTLTARVIGYRPRSAQLALRPGTIEQDFTLELNPLRLGEVVVTGAGTATTREKLGNVINSVQGDALVRSNEPNIVSALAGKAPNVEVRSAAGDPGASSYIRIRGVKTIQGTGQPLFVIDGVPIDNSTISTPLTSLGTPALQTPNGQTFLSGVSQPNRASDINPNDIESIEILKGAAAAAIYGARAAQGVVLITTKSGRLGATRATLRSSYSWDQVTQGPPLQRRFGQGVITSGSCDTDGCFGSPFSWGPELPPGTPTFDHFREMFRTGHMLDNTVTLSGGSERTAFYLSAGRLDHEGTVVGPNSWYDRTSLRLKASHQILERLTVGGNASYVETRGSFIQKGSNLSGLLLGALRTPPEFDNRQYLSPENGLHRSYRYPRPAGLNVSRGYDNPFWVLNAHVNESEANRVFGNFDVDYGPLDWLTFKWTVGGDYISDRQLQALPPSNSTWATGTLTRGDYTTYQIDHNLVGTATHTFGPNLAGSLTLGHNLNSRRFVQYFTTGFDYIDPTVHKLDNLITWIPNEFESLIHSESYFGQVTADLYDQLFLTAAIRNDGSSTFARSDRRHWFPKASAAWTFSALLPASPWLSFGKLRAAYGETGREPGVYQLFSGYAYGAFLDGGWGGFINATQAGLGGVALGITRGQENVRPERTREIEFGADLGFLDQRLDLGITVYDSRSTDVIFLAPLAPSTGYLQQVQNAATIDNDGLELTLNVRPVTTPNFAWDVGINWATNNNRVVSLQGAEFVNIPGAFAGAPAVAQVGSRVGVLQGFDYARCGRQLVINGVDIDAACGNAPAGALFIAGDGFPIVDPTTRIMMDPFPEWTGSVRSGVTLWGKLQLTGLLDVSQGGQVWNGTKGALYHFGTHRDTEIRGQTRTFGRDIMPGPVAGPGAETPVVIDLDWFTGLGSGFGPVVTNFVEDASWVKLRELSAAYSFDQPFVRNTTGLTSIDVRLAARNLKTWTDYTGIDPETNLGGAEVSQRGIDYFNNPQTRSFVLTIGLNR